MITAMFQGASHFSARDVTQNNHFFASEDGRNNGALKELYAHVAHVAMHSSEARADAPRCHEETREAVQKDISSWSESHTNKTRTRCTREAQKILWLTGPAGTGKTAIMGTVSDILERAGQLVATFYFSSGMGAAGTTSKRLFVTTLAYQMAVHPALKGRLAGFIISAFQENPAVFDMSLKRQIEVFVLGPLRRSQSHPGPASPLPTCILVDGVDECGGLGEGSDGRSRQEDQIEVLSILLQAANDPAFPFHFIVASRPETWIRSFFTQRAPGRVHEIFLDEKYSPDQDIRFYLTSMFAEMRRRCGLTSAIWPSEAAITQLVEDASGQFIYAATVIRFVDTPGASPQAQLDTVLNLKIRPDHAHARSNPFAMLDALYSSILKCGADPDSLVFWLKGVHILQKAFEGQLYPVSAWTIDRIFEEYEGQAQALLRSLPSLLHTVHWAAGFVIYRPSIQPEDGDPVGWNECYAFYHKSFFEYLESESRYGVAFPGIRKAGVNAWVDRRVAQSFERGSTNVPIPPSLAPTFQGCFLDLVILAERRGLIKINPKVFRNCEPSTWLCVHPFRYTPGFVARYLYTLVHKNCHSLLPCSRGCKRWRRATYKLSMDIWQLYPGSPWTPSDLRLDRFCIKRLVV